MLKLTSSPDELGTLQWELALCLLMAWSITFLSLIKGVKSVGKVGFCLSNTLSHGSESFGKVYLI